MSEDGTASEYKFNTRNTDTASRIEDKTSKIDDELSSIYVARWFKVLYHIYLQGQILML